MFQNVIDRDKTPGWLGGWLVKISLFFITSGNKFKGCLDNKNQLQKKNIGLTQSSSGFSITSYGITFWPTQYNDDDFYIFDVDMEKHLSHLDKTVLLSCCKGNERYVQCRNYIAEWKEQTIIKNRG